MSRRYDTDLKSLIGGRKEQQDFAGYLQKGDRLLAVVCDGMGGANGGAIAAKIAVKHVIDSFASFQGEDYVAAVADAIQESNRIIYWKANSDDDLTGMGTTIAAVLLAPHHATAFHVGDSRIYHLKKKRKSFRTFDHSRVFELVRQGVLTEEQARTATNSNIILRALGIRDFVDIEINDYLPYQRRDRFLLCSDGICGAISEENLLQMATSNGPLNEINQNLVQVVDATGNSMGGEHDNLTSLLIQCNSNSKLRTPISMRSKLVIALTSILVLMAGFFAYDHLRLSTKVASMTREIRELHIKIKSNDSVKVKEAVSKVESLQNSAPAPNLKKPQSANISGTLNFLVPKNTGPKQRTQSKNSPASIDSAKVKSSKNATDSLGVGSKLKNGNRLRSH
jgi:serine/threonine protein phosphatase PrpC